tara:strand:+ start:3624 stop:4955 length:1332 start_codon:yes stop_codon:yes gene_type:complete
MKKILYLLMMTSYVSFSQIISSDLEESFSIFDIQDIYTFGDIPSYIGDINYEVEAYKVLYYTPNENGELVIASGSIFIPINPTCPVPILSWQHGTVVSDLGAPSENISNSAIGIIAASHGYIVVVSDYLGLGSGEGFHNYCHADTEASAVIDLIINANTFVNLLDVETNGQLFLMGYSQGGHATMAAVKELEANFINELTVTASAPMAGPYSMSEAQAEMLNTVYPNPGYFPYIIFAYQNVYNNLYSDISEILKPGFEDLFDMYDGTYSMNDINESIWSIASELYEIDSVSFTPLNMINEDYYYAYQNNENHPFRLALEANDLLDFIPQSPMRLIHCNGDNDVAYENSVMAFESFSPFMNEEIFLLDGGSFNHSECAKSSIISAKLFFDGLVNFCDETYLEELHSKQKILKRFNILGQVITQENKNISIRLYNDGSVDKIIVF